jgi:hypothetical protein
MTLENEELLQLLSIGDLVVTRSLGLEDSPELLAISIKDESMMSIEQEGLDHWSYAEAALYFLAMQEAVELEMYPNITALWHEWQRRGRQEIKRRDPELHDRLREAFREMEGG